MSWPRRRDDEHGDVHASGKYGATRASSVWGGVQTYCNGPGHAPTSGKFEGTVMVMSAPEPEDAAADFSDEHARSPVISNRLGYGMCPPSSRYLKTVDSEMGTRPRMDRRVFSR